MEGAARYTAGVPRAQVTQRLSAVQVITNGDVLVGLRRVTPGAQHESWESYRKILFDSFYDRITLQFPRLT